MADDGAKDLARFAATYADEDVDLYDLLGVDALTPKEDIHRAWRKRSLKHHPDKAGAAFDAATWECFERARDILSDPTARAVYDNASKAKLLRRQERQAMEKEDRRFADDLEAREAAAARLRAEGEQRDREALQRERERLAGVQRRREEETRRQELAAQEAEDLAEAKRRLREKKEEKARRREAKESMKASMSTSKASGPSNGTVNVPGDYLFTAAKVDKKYWELVCDKLKAAQTVRNLQRTAASASELEEAERGLEEARRWIHEAEGKYERETAAF
ncbi:DNAJ domain protein Cwf23 [Drechmeria coniospora]|uniref:DNAJ domain protein Cwf23 n=1 Tax=Drechmeria coniospora TaxID=98403 RepID=A0A151GSF3_DRECN|nr:DNAJ domain protein Cwf23 [Drechmeria coniospora]KYK60037.1 DNAJ domain protein Cwf23 [Drechmeria coniospora]